MNTWPEPTTRRLLALYDQQLRTTAEMLDADEVAHIGPLWAAKFVHRRRGFITYASLEGDFLPELVDAALAHYRADERIDRVEWKTRGHDALPNLGAVLLDRGFCLGTPETVMVGPVDGVLAAGGDLPAGYRLELAESDAAIHEAEALAGRVFGDAVEDSRLFAEALIARRNADPAAFEMWVVRHDRDGVVCSGRVDFVPGTDFASLWGGACDAAHRHQGVYRALTAARAQSAQRHGKTHLHSDCSVHSRTILERSGLVAVTTTTPAVWHRSTASDHDCDDTAVVTSM